MVRFLQKTPIKPMIKVWIFSLDSSNKLCTTSETRNEAGQQANSDLGSNALPTCPLRNNAAIQVTAAVPVTAPRFSLGFCSHGWKEMRPRSPDGKHSSRDPYGALHDVSWVVTCLSCDFWFYINSALNH